VTDHQPDDILSMAGGEQPRRQAKRPRIGPLVQRTLLVCVLIATFAAGVGADRLGMLGGSPADASSSMTDQPQFKTLQQTWDLIHDQYVDQSAVVDSTLLYGAAKGMVDSLGDTGHSTFLTPDEAPAFQQATTGELIGIGVEVDFTSGIPTVIAPIDDSPAADAGVKPEDTITAIDGATTEGMSQTDVFKALRGDEGTPVDVTFERPSTGKSFTAHLVREKIKIDPVAWTMLPNKVALIRLSEFTNGATDEVKQALKDAKGQGATDLILDMRNNPGGLVTEAIGVASQFQPEGTPIYQFKERDKDPRTIKTTGIGEGTDLPMVVLINSGTASSAEIVASSLQDSGRAELIGETTFGTGTVLTPTVLDDGSIVLLGTGLWLTPNGKQIWHLGIAPNEKVDLAADVSPYRPEDGAITSSSALDATGDAQLVRAFSEITKSAGG
jgi:carboxyl-terminal processing protease